MRLPGSGPGWINWEFFGGSGEFFLGGSERALLPRESRDCSGIFSGIVPEFPSRDNPRKVFFFSFLHPWMDEPRGFQRFQILGIGGGEAAEPGDAAGFGVRRDGKWEFREFGPKFPGKTSIPPPGSAPKSPRKKGIFLGAGKRERTRLELGSEENDREFRHAEGREWMEKGEGGVGKIPAALLGKWRLSRNPWSGWNWEWGGFPPKNKNKNGKEAPGARIPRKSSGSLFGAGNET